jgi:hypothetical protein
MRLAGEDLNLDAKRLCSREWHAWVCGSRDLFDAVTEYLGKQADGDGGFLRLGTCRACGSTLALADDAGGSF